MSGTRDTGPDTGRGDDAGDEGGLDPQEAADLLDQTTRRARRRFDIRSPWLTALGAVVVLIAFGAVWLSVLGQHPYRGPTAAGLITLYVILIAWIGVVAAVNRRATAGVSGRSIRQQRGYGVVVLTALVAVSAVQGALRYEGVNQSIVYGIFPPTSQLIVLGAIGATVAAAREEWPAFGAGIAVTLLAAGAAFAGPVGVWLVDGIGCGVVVLGYGAAQAWRRSHEPRRA